MNLTQALCDYLSGLTVSQGGLAGQTFTVLPWQRRFVRSAFTAGIQSAALSVARGNGKTALLSGIACATLDGPLAVPRGETVIVASSFEQARIAFEHIMAFMADKLDDRARWKVWDTAQQARIEDRQTGARVRCIGSDPRRAHGLAPVLVLADEPSQWLETTGEKMVAALRTASGKQPHSRFVALGTRPADSEHWFAKMLSGGASYAQNHTANAGDPKFQRRTWSKGLCCKLGEGAMRDQGASCSPYDSALARRSCSHAMASVRAHGQRSKARSTIRASPTMPPWRANIPAWPLRSARITSKPLIVA